MIYKLIQDESGNYIDDSGSKFTLLEAIEFIDDPEGRNIDCLEFETIDLAMEYFGIERIEPILEPTDENPIA